MSTSQERTASHLAWLERESEGTADHCLKVYTPDGKFGELVETFAPEQEAEAVALVERLNASRKKLGPAFLAAAADCRELTAREEALAEGRCS